MDRYFILILSFLLFVNPVFSQVDTSKNKSHFSIGIKKENKKNINLQLNKELFDKLANEHIKKIVQYQNHILSKNIA